MRVQRTALMRLAEQKLPVVGDYFVRDIPPSDNVSALLGSAKESGLMDLSAAVLIYLPMRNGT